MNSTPEENAVPHENRWQLHDLYDRIGRETVASLPGTWTPEKWQAQKPVLRQAVARMVGFRPELLPRVEAERLGTTQRQGYSVERIVFHAWPNAPISANLYMPDNLASPAPAILCPHGHSMDGKAHGVYQHCYINLARRGYIVLAWDNIGHGEREAMGHKDGHWPLLAGLSLKGLMLIEGQALLTWLIEQEEVDGQHIGCTGNSGGGAQTLFLAALDTRIAAAAPAGHVSSLSFIADKEKNLCACTLLPNTIAIAEIEHILGLIAPRHAMIVSGRDDCLFPDDLVRRAHRLGRRMYELDGVADRLELFVGACGHGYEQPKREAMYAFFDRALKKMDSGQVNETPTSPEPPDSPVLRCWPALSPKFCTVRELARQLVGMLKQNDAAPYSLPEYLWRDLLGVRQAPKVIRADAHSSCDGWEKVLLRMSHRIQLPCVLSVPKKRTMRATVIIDDTGKESERATRCARAARERGEIVAALDLLGWGETKPRELLQRGDDETFAAQRGLYYGRPLAGERAAELAAVIEWLVITHALAESSVTCDAFGWAGLIALLLSAAERPEVSAALRKVRLHEFPVRSFWDETESPRPLFTFPYNILSIGDIASLASPRVSIDPDE